MTVAEEVDGRPQQSIHRAAVTGLGLHSALGDRRGVREAMAAGETGVRRLTLSGAQGFPAFAGARADLSMLDGMLSDRKLRKYMSRATELAVVAAGRALNDAGLLENDEVMRQLPLYAATGLIAFDFSSISKSLAQATSDDGHVDLRFVGERGLRLIHPLMPFKMLLNMPLGIVSIVYGIGGENMIVYPGTIQAGGALEAAVRGVSTGRFDRVLVGGCEQTLAAMPLAFMKRRGWLADDPDVTCPFSELHHGLAAGDLSAFLMIEAEEAAIARGARIYGFISSPTLLPGRPMVDAYELGQPPQRVLVTGSRNVEEDSALVEAIRRAWPHAPPSMISFDGAIGFARSASLFAHLVLAADDLGRDVQALATNAEGRKESGRRPDSKEIRPSSALLTAIEPAGGAVHVLLTGVSDDLTTTRTTGGAVSVVRRRPSRRRVVVTGMGVVSPIGVGRQAFYEGLASGRSGIGTIRSFDASTFPSRVAGEVRDLDVMTIGLPDDLRPALIRDPKSVFGVVAAREALGDAFGDAAIPIAPHRRAIYLAGGLEIFYLDDVAAHLDGERIDYRSLLQAVLQEPAESLIQIPADVGARVIAREFGAVTLNSLNLSACAAGMQALGEAFRAVADGSCDVALAGGYDSMINPLGVGGFCRLEVLSRNNEAGSEASRPFDAERDGFVLGEGSAVIVLEELEAALERGAHIRAEVFGYSSSLDAYRVSDPSPDNAGALRAIRGALADARLEPAEISYINAHGTGTLKNDPAEARSIRTAFGAVVEQVPVSSTKSQIGHLIGAAGAVEFCAGLFALERQTLPATTTLRQIAAGCELHHVARTPRRERVKTFLSNSFGFGGQNAAIVAGQVDL